MPAQKHTLDFTNVKEGGGVFNKKRLPEGDYRAKIAKVVDVLAKDKTPMFLYTIEVKHDGAVGTYPFYCKLVEEQLWKLRQLFAAAGVVIPKKRVALDPNKIVGRLIGVTLQDTEYNDKLQSEVQYAIPLSEVPGGDVEDEDDLDTDDEEDEEEEPTPPPAKKRTAKRQPEPEPEDDEEEEDEEDEEEAEPEPPKKPAKKAAPAATKKKSAAKTVTDDDLDELDLDDL